MSVVPNPKKVLFEVPLDEFRSTDVEGAGVIREDKDGNVFRWVKHDEATSVTATKYGLCCYDGSNRGKVKTPATASLNNRAGFWQAAVPGGQYGWIQCKGVGPGLAIRSGAASTDSQASVAAFASHWLGVNTKEYVSAAASTVAELAGLCVNAASIASLASSAVGTQTATFTFDFRL